MELHEFISETLVHIQRGVQRAIEQTADLAGVINPVFEQFGGYSNDHREKVEFDIAVTASESSRKEGSAGIRVLEIGASGKGEKGVEKSHVTRIRFSVPIIPPVQFVKSDLPPVDTELG